MAVTKTQQGLTRSLLLAPAALWIIGFFILPYLLLAYMSFKPTSSTGPYLPGFTLENYIFNLTDPFYWEIMFETVAQGVLTVVICLLLAYPVAYRLARGNSRHKGFWYTLVISPLLVGVVIRCYGWMVLLADKGLINDGLLSLGLIDAPLPLMYNRLGTMIGMIQVYLPYMVISLTGSIQAVNPELDYTARSLGCQSFHGLSQNYPAHVFAGHPVRLHHGLRAHHQFLCHSHSARRQPYRHHAAAYRPEYSGSLRLARRGIYGRHHVRRGGHFAHAVYQAYDQRHAGVEMNQRKTWADSSPVRGGRRCIRLFGPAHHRGPAGRVQQRGISALSARGTVVALVP